MKWIVPVALLLSGCIERKPWPQPSDGARRDAVSGRDTAALDSKAKDVGARDTGVVRDVRVPAPDGVRRVDGRLADAKRPIDSSSARLDGRAKDIGTPQDLRRVDLRRGDAARLDAVRVDAARVDAPKPDLKPPAGWVVAYAETFEGAALGSAAWQADTFPDDGPFSDNGVYFQQQGIKPPAAYRISLPFGKDRWLTLESYTRDKARALTTLAQIVADPAGGSNHVLRIASPDHTDATVVRPTQALPARYRVSLRVGYPSFGDGLPGNNGYDGGETAGPWRDASATTDNGFYWLTILDALPRPHNNLWIHHHRKVVIDSDNHYPPWMEIWNGRNFVTSGEHPVMMFALDGLGAGTLLTGKPFIAYSAGSWQSEDDTGAIRAVDAYKPSTWYRVAIERSGDVFTLRVEGDFAFGGNQVYQASIDASARCLWHYVRQAPVRAACIDTTSWGSLGVAYPKWPADGLWPDYFMFGDPHSNYYEGQVYYDDVKLEIWQ